MVSAEHMTRPMDGPLNRLQGILDHHGIRLRTTKGNIWLLDSTPTTGTVVVSAATMTNNWTLKETFSCRGRTVGQIFEQVNGHLTTSPFDNYLSSGTCIKVAKKAMEFCKNGDQGGRGGLGGLGGLGGGSLMQQLRDRFKQHSNEGWQG